MVTSSKPMNIGANTTLKSVATAAATPASAAYPERRAADRPVAASARTERNVGRLTRLSICVCSWKEQDP
jgi:hypothetical protein